MIPVPPAAENSSFSGIYCHAQEIAPFGSAPGHPLSCLLAAAIPSSGEDLDLSRIYYHEHQIASLACGRSPHTVLHWAAPKISPERAPIPHESHADSRQFYFNLAGHLLWKRGHRRTSLDTETAKQSRRQQIATLKTFGNSYRKSLNFRDLQESQQSDSNRRPSDYISDALPTELCWRFLPERAVI